MKGIVSCVEVVAFVWISIRLVVVRHVLTVSKIRYQSGFNDDSNRTE